MCPFGARGRKKRVEQLAARGDVAGLMEALREEICRTFGDSSFGGGPDASVLFGARDALLAAGSSGVDALVQALRTDDDERVRAVLVHYVARIDGPAGSDALVGALTDRSTEVRWGAADLLADRGDARAVDVLVEHAHARPEFVADSVILLVSKAEQTGEPSSVADVFRQVLDAKPDVATWMRVGGMMGASAAGDDHRRRGERVLEVIGGPVAGAARRAEAVCVWCSNEGEAERLLAAAGDGAIESRALVDALARYPSPRVSEFVHAVLEAPASARIAALSASSPVGGIAVVLTLEGPDLESSAQSGTWSSSAAPAELAGFRQLFDAHRALVESLVPLEEAAARSIFARVGIPEPTRYPDAIHAFSSLRQWAEPGARFESHRLRLDDASPGEDFVYVHLADDALPLGFLVCALVGGGFLGYYRTGTELRTALGL